MITRSDVVVAISNLGRKRPSLCFFAPAPEEYGGPFDCARRAKVDIDSWPRNPQWL